MEILGTFEKEWPVISQAPWSVATIVLVVVILVALFTRWAGSSQLASKQGQLDLANDRIGDYERKLSGASPDQAAARISALEERLAVLEPRRLTASQMQELTYLLEGRAGSIHIAKDGTSQKSQAIQHQLQQVFSQAKWNVATSMVLGPSPLPTTGIGLQGIASEPDTSRIRSAFDRIGLAYNYYPSDNDGVPRIILTDGAHS